MCATKDDLQRELEVHRRQLERNLVTKRELLDVEGRLIQRLSYTTKLCEMILDQIQPDWRDSLPRREA